MKEFSLANNFVNGKFGHYSKGTTHIVYTPLEFIERLIALVPRPRINVIRFSGVFAPHSKYRSKIVPKPTKNKNESQKPTLEDDEETEFNKNQKITWAQRLKRAFNIDITKCPGEVRIIVAIEDPRVIKKTLEHMGIDPAPSTPLENTQNLPNTRGPTKKLAPMSCLSYLQINL